VLRLLTALEQLVVGARDQVGRRLVSGELREAGADRAGAGGRRE